MYDLLAGSQNMETSYLMSRGKALEAFPMLKREGLVGAVVYYDGQHNDSRMNVALIMTAVLHGAVAANHVSLTALRKNAAGKIIGGRVKDELTGKEWEVKAKVRICALQPPVPINHMGMHIGYYQRNWSVYRCYPSNGCRLCAGCVAPGCS